ncbi:hypothetical protein nbrc107696_30050 [Gordonia spumicola]|uniref:YCII-related domain-containing protein n=1 Tax=Gordonia spumicola TaxID=589161 RepID=A0A7I9VB45_9ACTN|nr:YciI family protein [Gordonia spumicola]GEE02559.1 hypothetical protein nbrc107696_30050 [Gordonia spumicola]
MPVFHVDYTYDPDSASVRDEHRPAHRAYFRTLFDDGRLLFIGPFVDGSGAALMLVAADEEAVRELLANDPFVERDAVSAIRVTEWRQVLGPFGDT